MGLNRIRETAAERRLRESEERYRSLFDKASDGVIIISPDGKLIEVNESFARMHGYSTGELLRMNIRDLDTPEYRPVDSRTYAPASRGGNPCLRGGTPSQGWPCISAGGFGRPYISRRRILHPVFSPRHHRAEAGGRCQEGSLGVPRGDRRVCRRGDLRLPRHTRTSLRSVHGLEQPDDRNYRLHDGGDQPPRLVPGGLPRSRGSGKGEGPHGTYAAGRQPERRGLGDHPVRRDKAGDHHIHLDPARERGGRSCLGALPGHNRPQAGGGGVAGERGPVPTNGGVLAGTDRHRRPGWND